MKEALARKEYEIFPYLYYASYYKAFPSFFPMGWLEYLIKDWKFICCELSGQLQEMHARLAIIHTSGFL